MVCIEKRPYTLYGRLATLHFRYLTCLLDRGHITDRLFFSWIGGIYGRKKRAAESDGDREENPASP